MTRQENRKSQYETYTSAQPTGYIDDNTGEDIQYITKRSEYIYTATNQIVRIIEKMYDEENEEKLEKTTNYIYDENGNEIMQSSSYIHPHTIKMRQSTKGNLTGETVNQDIDTLIERQVNTFDGFNRLKQTERVKDGVRTTVAYTYNGDDLRTKKEVKKSSNGYKAEITNYHYDRQHVILETDETDNIKTSYVRGINYIARKNNANILTYYLYNGHGDVVQTVTKDGTIQNQYDYDIFGTPTLTIEQQEENIRYAGEYFDRETGLYYLRARYYNPYTGRFISEDSYWGEDTNPLSLNLYTYCHNDPIMYVDPSGHLSEQQQKNIDSVNRAYKYGFVTKDERDANIRLNGGTVDDDNSSGGNRSSGSRSSSRSRRSSSSKSNSSNLSDKQYEDTINTINDLINKGQISQDEGDTAINRINNPENKNSYIDDNGTVHVSPNHPYNEKSKKRQTIFAINDLYENGVITQELMQEALHRVLSIPSNDDTPINKPEVEYQSEEEIADQILQYDSLLKYNPKVAELQKRLNELGYVGKNGEQLAEDGQFGSNTLHAVNSFKDTNKLWNHGEYAGKVGDTTWGLLFSDDAIKAKVVGGSGEVYINGYENLISLDSMYINEDLLTVYESVHLSPEEKAKLTKQRELLTKDEVSQLDTYARIAENVYTGTKGDIIDGWKMVEDPYIKGSLRMAVYQRVGANGEEYIIANAGTEATSLEDWENNLKQLIGESDDMWNSIANAEDFVESHPDAQITFVGHSKGGAEAAANAAATNNNAILFNPAWVNLAAYKQEKSEYDASMTAYVVKGDILNTAEGWLPKPFDYVVYLPKQYHVNTPSKAVNVVNSVRNHLMPAVREAIKEYEKR